MDCKQYEVGIRDKQGRMMSRKWTQAEVLKSVSWLKRENARGSDIYIRPAGEKNQGIILMDDLSQYQLDRLKDKRIEPAAVVETSPQNFQAWVRLTSRELSPEIATATSKGLAAYFDADPNSADWRHYGRLAGFTNRKPEHTTENGQNPWVLCHESNGNQATTGEHLVKRATEAVAERKRESERKSRLEAAKNATGRTYGRDPIAEYQKQLKTLTGRYGEDMDLSRADFMICKDMAKRGYNEKQLIQALQEASPELATRKASHEQDYCQRTARAASEPVL